MADSGSRTTVAAASRGPKRNAATTRTNLLSAARRRFVTHGFDRTTTRDIAGDAGVNVALINRYFGSKVGLFEACLEEPTSLRLALIADGRTIAENLADQFKQLDSPEYGLQMPLMLWLRGPSDERAAALRSRGMEGFAEAILEAAGGAPTPDRRLRAQLVLALGLGVATLRATVAMQPLGTVAADALVGPLDDAVVALLGPMPATKRKPA